VIKGDLLQTINILHGFLYDKTQAYSIEAVLSELYSQLNADCANLAVKAIVVILK